MQDPTRAVAIQLHNLTIVLCDELHNRLWPAEFFPQLFCAHLPYGAVRKGLQEHAVLLSKLSTLCPSSLSFVTPKLFHFMRFKNSLGEVLAGPGAPKSSFKS